MLFKSSLLLLASVASVFAQDNAAKDVPPVAASDAKDLKADVKVTFPDADILGLRLINGHPTRALIEVSNKEAAAINVAFVTGALTNPEVLPEGTPAYQSIVRNLTNMQYNTAIQAGETKSVSYAFAQDLHPQDVRLRLMAVITDSKGNLYSVPAYDAVAAVVEAPTSFFDPQIIFLYLVLSGAFAATLYFVYKTWIETLFPQAAPKRAPKKARKSIDPDTLANSSENVAVATGKIDESWIPDHHIARPSGKRAKSGTPKSK